MYSVCVNKRPIKIAFLVDSKKQGWQEQLDAIWKYNSDKWGGRFNVIAPLDGETLKPEWLGFLKRIDCDHIVSTVNLSEDLAAELKKELCPIAVEVLRENNEPTVKPHIHTYNDTIRVKPTPNNLAKMGRIPFVEPLLAVLRCHLTQDKLRRRLTTDKDVERFVLRNFGYFPEAVYQDNLLKNVRHEVIIINDRTELADALRKLAEMSANYVYPIQLSALEASKHYVDYQPEHLYDVFGLIVGDTLEDQLFSWHKPLYSRELQDYRLNHIWLSTAFAEDEEIMKAIGVWLRRMTERVHLFSHSLSEEKLTEIGARLDKTDGDLFFMKHLSKGVTAFDSYTFPEFSEPRYLSFWEGGGSSLQPPKESDYYRAYNLQEVFEVKSPSFADGLSEQGQWIAEVYIEADKSRHYNDRYYSIQGRSYWWRLPRMNHLAVGILRDNVKDRGKARVNAQGVPVVQLPAKGPQLKIQLPSERNLLAKCVMGDINGRMSRQIKRTGTEIEYVEESNIGRYLRGFLEVFGGLAFAHNVLSERFWRNAFDVLSGKEAEKEGKILEEVQNTLRKKIHDGLTKTQKVNNYVGLAEYVIQLSKKVSLEGKTIDMKSFLSMAETEHEEFKLTEGKDWAFNVTAFRQSISTMLELGVLQMGYEQKCPRCGSRTWYLIDEAAQKLVCNGCRYEFSMLAEPTATYRLSSLVRQGIFAHGLAPVVLVLGQLLRNAQSSFFLAPCLDLYRVEPDPDGETKYIKITDLDIACIKDGLFVIGELKQSQSQFKEEQSLRLAEVAETIGADILLFSSLEATQSNRTKDIIAKVKERLKGSKVQAGWYQLGERVFEPSRMDH